MAGHRSLDPRMVVRIHRGQLKCEGEGARAVAVFPPALTPSRPRALSMTAVLERNPTSDPSPSMDGLAVPSRGLKLMSGGANRPLDEAVAESLGVPLTRVNLGRFADGEISVRIDENVRGNDVFIMQPTN